MAPRCYVIQGHAVPEEPSRSIEPINRLPARFLRIPARVSCQLQLV
jgi:hypothetical protein